MIIRPATDADHEAVVAVWKESWDSIGINNEKDDAVTIDVLHAGLGKKLAAGASLFAAEAEGRIVAMMLVDVPDNCLDQIFVLPAFQRTGIGKALLSHARSLMPEEIWLGTAAENETARAWYEREGFVLEQIKPFEEFRRNIAYYRWRAG